MSTRARTHTHTHTLSCFIISSSSSSRSSSVFVTTFMQGIYIYIAEKNHISRLCTVAPVLYLQFVLHVMLFHMLNVFYYYLLLLLLLIIMKPLS